MEFERQGKNHERQRKVHVSNFFLCGMNFFSYPHISLKKKNQKKLIFKVQNVKNGKKRIYGPNSNIEKGALGHPTNLLVVLLQPNR